MTTEEFYKLKTEVLAEAERLKSEIIASFNTRVAAFEKAQKQADVEPPMLTEDEHERIETRRSDFRLDARCSLRLRHVEAELARLREGLKVQEGDYPDKVIREYCDLGNLFAIEIQRHRKLVAK